VASASIKITSSIIRDLCAFVRRWDLLPSVNCRGGRLSLSRYDPSYLASLDQSWTFSHGCHEKYCPRNICPGCYVCDNGDSYSRFTSDVDKAVWLLFCDILVWVFLLMVNDYFNSYVRAHSLGIAAQLKIVGEPSSVFSGLWFDCLWLPPGKYKIVSWKKKYFQDIEDLLIFLDFIL
jgi:hypothetical protein